MNWFDITINAWEAMYALIGLLIPILCISLLIRLFGKSAKKTVRSFKN
jgi:hypothetical protein